MAPATRSSSADLPLSPLPTATEEAEAEDDFLRRRESALGRKDADVEGVVEGGDEGDPEEGEDVDAFLRRRNEMDFGLNAGDDDGAVKLTDDVADDIKQLKAKLGPV